MCVCVRVSSLHLCSSLQVNIIIVKILNVTQSRAEKEIVREDEQTYCIALGERREEFGVAANTVLCSCSI